MRVTMGMGSSNGPHGPSWTDAERTNWCCSWRTRLAIGPWSMAEEVQNCDPLHSVIHFSILEQRMATAWVLCTEVDRNSTRFLLIPPRHAYKTLNHVKSLFCFHIEGQEGPSFSSSSAAVSLLLITNRAFFDR